MSRRAEHHHDQDGRSTADEAKLTNGRKVPEQTRFSLSYGAAAMQQLTRMVLIPAFSMTRPKDLFEPSHPA
jgi:hypothetical protein